MTAPTVTETVATDFHCKHCNRPMWRKGSPPADRPPGSILHSGRGACTTCYHRLFTLGGHATEKAEHRPPPALDTSVDTSWHALGACREADDTLFFHPEGERGRARRRRAEEAKAICRTCPVMATCQRDALERREPYGTWGAMSEEERTRALAGRAVAA